MNIRHSVDDNRLRNNPYRFFFLRNENVPGILDSYPMGGQAKRFYIYGKQNINPFSVIFFAKHEINCIHAKLFRKGAVKCENLLYLLA